MHDTMDGTATTTQPFDRIPMSWDEYQSLGPLVRGEYIDGALIVAPAPGGRHQDIAWNLTAIIREVLPPSAHVREGWGWQPGADEFIPDVMVFDRSSSADDRRLTAIPHLVVEILSSDPAADMIRKAAKYGATGLERYWIIDPEGPEILIHQVVEGVFVERKRHGAGTEVTLNIGPVEVTLDPGRLLG